MDATATLAAPGPADSGRHARLRQQAQELEGVFLTTLMKQMFTSVGGEDAGFGGGFAEQTWRGMQAEQFAASMAEAGGIGLADAIVDNLLFVQEASPIPPSNHPHGAPK